MEHKCDHKTALVIFRSESLGLTQLQCTSFCGQPYWMLREGLVSREITPGEAIERLEKARRTVGHCR